MGREKGEKEGGLGLEKRQEEKQERNDAERLGIRIN